MSTKQSTPWLDQFVLQPLSELSQWAWRTERRTEFLWRNAFDDHLRDPIFNAGQALLQVLRKNEGLALGEERELPDEAEHSQAIIDEIALFMRENWLPGGMQRFGNTKTFGVLRGWFEVLPDLPQNLRHGVFAQPKRYPAWVRFSGPGPYAPPDLDDLGQCSIGIKLMGVPGPKLMDDESATQDLIMVSPASFVTANVRDNARLQKHVRAQTNLFYFIDPRHPRLFAALFQALYSRVHSSPLETPYWSNVPFRLGPEQAVQYSLMPVDRSRTPIPARPGNNYLRRAMVNTLSRREWVFDFRVQLQTDAHRMPIEDAVVKWPAALSPYQVVARLHLPMQHFDSDAQLAFADRLSYNPWHSLEAHRPLGNQNRARLRMYRTLAELRQGANGTPHVEPTGAEAFPDSPPHMSGQWPDGPSGARRSATASRRKATESKA